MQVLEKVVGDFDWLVPQLLEKTQRVDDFFFDAAAQIQMEQWYNGRVALVGDACQCLTLLAGQGASMGMAGAYLLDSSEGQPDFGLMILMLTYIVVQGILYSYWLKHIVILDIFTIAAGFVLRAVAGGVVLDIRITPWLLVCMGLLSLFLGLGKRRAELVLLGDDANQHRRILQEYSLPMLDQLIAMVTAGTIIAYTLFTYNAHTDNRGPYPMLMATVPFVVYAIFRYIYLIHQQGGGGSPEELVMKDRPLALSIALYGISVLLIMAFFPSM